MRDYSAAIQKAVEQGVDFSCDYHAQSVGGLMADLAKSHGYRKPKNANGSTGRYFFQLLQRRLTDKPFRGFVSRRSVISTSK